MLIIALVVAFLLKGEHMQVSAQRFFYNLFIDGLWGSFWWVCVTALIIQLFYYKKVSDLTMRFMLSVFLVVLLTFLLSYLRTPYRLGWTDSGNRIVFHIAPVVLLWLASLWKDLLVIGHKKRTT
jgi:urea transporter